MFSLSELNPFPLRACLNCGSWLNLRTFFCEKCHRKCLEQFHPTSEVMIEDIKIKSLLRWPPGESDVLSSLVLQMKDETTVAWKVWAQEFLLHNQFHKNKKTILLSSRSSSGKKHAQNWGEALSLVSGYPHFCPLTPANPLEKQKELGRFERHKRAFNLDEEFSKPRHSRIIFVDDVVTTGQTALAAYRALKKPSDFEVWAFIYREL